ncbi:MAG: YiiD C-terminal domain-containing protein [Fimbriimonadaceae bacterium]|nr:YiiD C-terminal domain-containing protein [Fimbriimonadaceae bacterium]
MVAPQHPEAWEAYVRDQIPLMRAMGMSVSAMTVTASSPARVELSFPLAGNQNHYGTGFGGSIATAATTAAWLLATALLATADHVPTVLIRRSQVEFTAPVRGPFRAVANISEPERDAYVRAYARRGKSVVELKATVHTGDELCAEFTGLFVALPNASSA